MARGKFLSHSQAARLYDILGAGLETQAFYEAAALRGLAAHLEWNSCESVVEFGCGTGRFAEELLEARLPPRATYPGLDVSAKMVRLTKSRLRRFGERANIRQTNGAPYIEAADGGFDRFISAYVLDLLSDDDIHALLREAHRVLKPDGLVGLACLTTGPSLTSGLISTVWGRLHRLSPWLVGGCRPPVLRNYLSSAAWQVECVGVAVRFGIPSEIVVANPVKRPGQY